MATIPQPTAELMQIAPLHRFSTADFLEMLEKGVLGPDDHVELIGGIIVEMSPAGSRHNHFLGQLNELFGSLLGRVVIWIQGTLVVAEGEVYDPDFMILRRKPGGYKNQLPRPQDVLLIVEAAESSMQRDQKFKLPVYAAAGIPEYWIADLDRELLIVHREPDGAAYSAIDTRQGDLLVSPMAAPDISFAVRKAFE
jgi:Uma2 family endonuclease